MSHFSKMQAYQKLNKTMPEESEVDSASIAETTSTMFEIEEPTEGSSGDNQSSAPSSSNDSPSTWTDSVMWGLICCIFLFQAYCTHQLITSETGSKDLMMLEVGVLEFISIASLVKLNSKKNITPAVILFHTFYFFLVILTSIPYLDRQSSKSKSSV